MEARIQSRRIAAKLLELSCDESGRLDSGRVASVLDALAATPPPHHREVLRLFLGEVRRHEEWSTLRIASAVPLDGDELEQVAKGIQARYQRQLQPVVTVDPALIAGFRAQVGDDVYDSSLRTRLADIQTL